MPPDQDRGLEICPLCDAGAADDNRRGIRRTRGKQRSAAVTTKHLRAPVATLGNLDIALRCAAEASIVVLLVG